MYREQVPCYNCSKRHDYCHGKCDEYKEYRQKLERENAIRDQLILENNICMKSVERLRKKFRKPLAQR